MWMDNGDYECYSLHACTPQFAGIVDANFELQCSRENAALYSEVGQLQHTANCGALLEMAQVLCRICFRPVVTALTHTQHTQHWTAPLHSLSQVHVRSVACNLRTWRVSTQRSHLKHTSRGARAPRAEAEAEAPLDIRRKVVFLGTPEVISWCHVTIRACIRPVSNV